jgi:DNA processing protein
MDSMGEREYYVGFSVFPGVGPKRLAELLQYFGNAAQAWNGKDTDLLRILGAVYGTKFLRFREEFSLTAYLQKLAHNDVWYVASVDPDYPVLLQQLENAPIVLYGKGEKAILSPKRRGESQTDIYIGVVGTRKITGYGRQVTEMITRELVDAGCIIVSGLALGVDAVAHTATMGEGGKTIAVLGSGVDVCHPTSNAGIYQRIITGGGAVMSEYPLGEPPSKGSFPSRNRIIAGLSHGIVVTEGAADSGALITAEDALKIGRNVYAVPGPITSSLSVGPNALLAKGAKLVTSGKDILQEFHMANGHYPLSKKKEITGETEEEQMILDLLQRETLLFDEIVRRTGFDPSKTGVLLSLMEMKGQIVSLAAGEYRLRT